MQKIVFLLALIVIVGISSNYSYSQEISLATFQENIQIIVDKNTSQKVTASVTLQSTSIQEIKIPAELEQRIRDNERVKAVILTNQNQCVLGVENQSCIMINVERDPLDKGIIAIQNSTKQIADSYIDEINETFDTNAEFFQVFVHTDSQTNEALETSGAVSGRGMISAVYTMPMEDTNTMYEKITAMTIPKIIRDSGGFYDVARNLASEENAKMTFSLIPLDSKSLLQLKLSVDYPDKAPTILEVSPLDLLKVDNISRSDYFSAGFYPLNSIIQVAIISSEDTSVSNVRGDTIPTQMIGNEEIPIEVTNNGWIFDPKEGKVIQGKYIFGKETTIEREELKFSLESEQPHEISPPQPPSDKVEFDESVLIVGIITIVAIAAAVFYLKGYKK